MATLAALHQQVLCQLERALPGLPRPARKRLALLVAAVLGADSCALRELARAGAACRPGPRPDRVRRRLQRTLDDPSLDPARCWAPLARQAVAWPGPGGPPVVLALDDSRLGDRVHLLRLALAYRGGALPLAWRCWPEGAPLPAGAYRRRVAALLGEAAAIVPPGAPVVVVADRAFDAPWLLDLVAARGWHWAVRLKARGTVRCRGADGRPEPLAPRLAAALPGPGAAWAWAGERFARAGWRPARLAAVWARGRPEPLVVATSLPPEADALACYARRAWVEAGFRADKRGGFQWQACRCPDPARHERLLLGLAVAALLATALAAADPPRAAADARDSLLRRGRLALRRALRGGPLPPLRLRLPDPSGPAWAHQVAACFPRPPTPPQTVPL